MIRRHLPRLGPNVKRPSPKTARQWVNAAGSNSKTAFEVSRELQPEWGPFFAIDGTPMRIKGEGHCFLIASDCATQDTPHAVLLPDEHDTRRIGVFLNELLALGIDPKMWLIDDNPSLKKAIIKHQRFAKIQLDIFHKKRTIARLLPDKKINKQEEELKNRIFQFLAANSLEEAETFFKSILINRQLWPSRGSKRAILSIESDHDLLLTHFHVDKTLGLTGDKRSPRTTSEIEGVNSRIGPKRDKVRGFKTLESTKNFCNLLIMHYRAGPFESTNDKRGPLERANRKVYDWIRFSQKRKSIRETKAPRV